MTPDVAAAIALSASAFAVAYTVFATINMARAQQRFYDEMANITASTNARIDAAYRDANERIIAAARDAYDKLATDALRR